MTNKYPSFVDAQMQGTYLGKPHVFWCQLLEEIEEKGRDYDKILVEALVAKYDLIRQLDVSRQDWRKLRELVETNFPRPNPDL